jgi:hypothetical protein
VAALLALAIAVGVAGCGEDEGVSEGAVVTAYVEKPLCEGATHQALEGDSTQGGAFEVRLICLADARGRRGVELATVGANARRATEDSRTVAYIGEPGTTARFSRPILEAAGIGWITANSRAEATQQLLSALLESDSSSLRADVREALGQP